MRLILIFIVISVFYNESFAAELNGDGKIPVFVVNVGRSLMPKTDCKTNCSPMMMRIRFSQSDFEVTEVSITKSGEAWNPELIREDDVIRGWSGPEWNCDSTVVVKIGIQHKKTSVRKVINERTTVKCSH
jgi:hypothetical protein